MVSHAWENSSIPSRTNCLIATALIALIHGQRDPYLDGHCHRRKRNRNHRAKIGNRPYSRHHHPGQQSRKYKTVFEVASITLMILNGNYSKIDSYQVGMGLLWIASPIAVISGIEYFKKFIKTVMV